MSLNTNKHSVHLEIDLGAIKHNLEVYKSYLKPTTGFIAVVKANAYGSGSIKIAQTLERYGVSYLAVAFAHEGVELRDAGIIAPIIVFNSDIASIPDMLEYNLEPEIYSVNQLGILSKHCNKNKKTCNVHLNIDTGMHRFGILENELSDIGNIFNANKYLNIKTVFTHLSCSEDCYDDGYTKNQFGSFDKLSTEFEKLLGYTIKKHVLNSGGISRFSSGQYDFVRIGIGLYGIDNNIECSNKLRYVHSLQAKIIQIKKLKAGSSIGYNRKTRLEKETKIGIVNIGYADGIFRILGNRNFHFLVHGKKADILGNVSMDSIIIDLSEIPEAVIDSEVTIYGTSHPIEHLAQAANTIPYEILTKISNRIEKKYI